MSHPTFRRNCTVLPSIVCRLLRGTYFPLFSQSKVPLLLRLRDQVEASGWAVAEHRDKSAAPRRRVCQTSMSTDNSPQEDLYISWDWDPRSIAILSVSRRQYAMDARISPWTISTRSMRTWDRLSPSIQQRVSHLYSYTARIYFQCMRHPKHCKHLVLKNTMHLLISTP